MTISGAGMPRRMPSRQTTDFAALRDHVYPMLKPVTLLALVHERQLPMLAYQHFLADVIITYVIEAEQHVSYINEQHLVAWSLDVPTLHTQAVMNLRQRTAYDGLQVLGSGASRLLLFHQQDGYDATRILLPDLLTSWQTLLPGTLLLGIPNRDFLLGFSDNDPELLQRMAHQIQADRMQHAAGLTDQLFTLVNGVVQPYVWE